MCLQVQVSVCLYYIEWVSSSVRCFECILYIVHRPDRLPHVPFDFPFLNDILKLGLLEYKLIKYKPYLYSIYYNNIICIKIQINKQIKTCYSILFVYPLTIEMARVINNTRDLLVIIRTYKQWEKYVGLIRAGFRWHVPQVRNFLGVPLRTRACRRMGDENAVPKNLSRQ